MPPSDAKNPLHPFSILRGATHLRMQILLHSHERRKKPVALVDLSSKVRCTCRLLTGLNDYKIRYIFMASRNAGTCFDHVK